MELKTGTKYIFFLKKAVVGKHDPMDRPRVYGFPAIIIV
jgi:hypothetical protein